MAKHSHDNQLNFKHGISIYGRRNRDQTFGKSLIYQFLFPIMKFRSAMRHQSNSPQYYPVIVLTLALLSLFLTSCVSTNTTSLYGNLGRFQYLSQPDVKAFNDSIQAPETNQVLSTAEMQMLDIAKGYLQGYLPKEDTLQSLIGLEEATLKFALDPDQVQILRETDTDYVRMGFQATTSHEKRSLIILGRPSIFVKYDLASVTPESSRLLDSLHKNGIPVIAVLGKARIGTPKDIVRAIEIGSKAMDHLYRARETAFLTGGYKGAIDDVYGYTRIGYERAKDLGAYTLVVMPEAGRKDSHKYVDVKDFVGKMWGDDTPALAGITDGAMIFAPYGSWTKIEIDTLLHYEKPVVIINPNQENRVETVNSKIGSVKSYRIPEEAAQALLEALPTTEALVASAPEDAEKLPIRNQAISEIEYYPFPRWFYYSEPQTATSRVMRSQQERRR